MNRYRPVFLLLGLLVLTASMSPAQFNVTSGITERAWNSLVQQDQLSSVMAVTQTATALPGLAPAPRGIDNAGNVLPSVAPNRSVAPRTGVAPSARTAATNEVTVSGFDALLDNNTVIPPDTWGCVGPNHVVTMLNSQVRIQSKSGAIISTVSLTSFWSPLGSSNLTDPRLLYDPTSQRWFASISIDPATASGKVGLAVSATADPAGTWRYMSFACATSRWADYPALGYNNKWIVITANIYSVVGQFKGVGMWAIDKAAALLPSGTVGAKRFDAGFDNSGTRTNPVVGFTMQPAMGYTATDTLYLVDNSNYYDSGDTTFLIRISRLTGTVSDPTWAAIPGSAYGTTAGLFKVQNNFNANQVDAPQLGSAALISTNDDRVMNVTYRSGHLFLAHSGGLPPKIAPTPDRTAAFWYELNPLSTSPIVQSGIVDGGTGVHYMFPSVAANALNEVVIGFTRCDATRYAEAAFTYHLETDLPGTTTAVATLKAGLGPYSKYYGGSRNRWGDYSYTCVDPTDDVTFWTIQEYAGVPSGSGTDSGEWATYWAKIYLGVPLPVQVASFRGALTATGTVRIEWTTASELNCYGFQIERSIGTADAYAVVPNSFVAGNGTTLEQHSYAFEDSPDAPGPYYYRLDQIDQDGTIHVSEPVKVDALTSVASGTVPLSTALLQNYPNPFNPVTTIGYTVGGIGDRGPGIRNVKLSIYNLLGQEVATLVNEQQAPGRYTVRFDGSRLASGVYLYRLSAGSYVETKRLALLK